ncbi:MULTISPECIES: response regulator transcription factor [Paenibacillus]|jgi:DNA-binding response OmpR family regulator|uniref:response regulator transcription factor n=1 Tax=Paenibacillus TaxID=44249 RepID=UPI000D31BF2A|nr:MULTISPECIES: response regulator transcription factor [Paenibacillus]MDP9678956.1 DNA-binding response OmpR family regulator [Paenibacillus jamilae]KAF6583523.1 response regulator transcription factor [Paenibacillus sp. EKM211P]KAF6614931.1 response regulator transcription factor [Paenibacillus sp. EKM101P]KAF6618126.1 response regulator transcription factor [Paenibacillus sp. EKM102P]KAF6626317.1 response regulator transcription factor [Paenibacillus sp. EKM10P]
MEKSVLVIDDEAKISRLLQLELSHEGYAVEIAQTGKEGLEKALSLTWDIIILDVMLPEMNGVEVLKQIRKVDNYTPVIMVTARNTTPEKVSGLDEGANDYITKPFEIEELLARMRASMRNQLEPAATTSQKEEKQQSKLQVDSLVLEPKTRSVVREGKRIELTPKEFDLLLYLMEHKNQVLHRDQMIQDVWGFDFVGDTNVVDVYIRYVRKKIDHGYKKKLIKTVRGVGYCIREEDH